MILKKCIVKEYRAILLEGYEVQEHVVWWMELKVKGDWK